MEGSTREPTTASGAITQAVTTATVQTPWAPVAPSLLERLPPIEQFREIVRNGVNKATAAMLGFANDPNVSPYVDDIFAYLQARADGALGRGRPNRLQQ